MVSKQAVTNMHLDGRKQTSTKIVRTVVPIRKETVLTSFCRIPSRITRYLATRGTFSQYNTTTYTRKEKKTSTKRGRNLKQKGRKEGRKEGRKNLKKNEANVRSGCKVEVAVCWYDQRYGVPS